LRRGRSPICAVPLDFFILFHYFSTEPRKGLGMIEWHRVFGLTLADFFTGSPYRVEVEKDLSLKQQFVDVVIIEWEAGGPMPELPDGLEDLARHNLLSYKSRHEPVTGWTLDELLAYYVNYRKQASAAAKKLLPVDDFRLYVVCTRMPKKLAAVIPFKPFKKGVYEIQWATHKIHVLVLSQIPKTKRNAIWQLFSGIGEKVQFGAANYKWRQPDKSGIINEFYKHYHVEGITMPYTWDDYYRQVTHEHLHWLTPEERLEGLPAKERLKGLPVEERLKGLPPKEIEAYLKKLRQKNGKENRRRALKRPPR